MKKAGAAEKRKARKSSASVQNVSKDPSSDNPPRTQMSNMGTSRKMRSQSNIATGVIVAIFGAAWIVLGKRIWFFPNILAEKATLRELFYFWPKKDKEERPKWTARLFYAIFAVLVILLLRHHAPNEAARARYQKRMSNIIDDVLEWSPSLALSEMMEKQIVFNATEDNNKFSNEREITSETVTSVNDETRSFKKSTNIVPIFGIDDVRT